MINKISGKKVIFITVYYSSGKSKLARELTENYHVYKINNINDILYKAFLNTSITSIIIEDCKPNSDLISGLSAIFNKFQNLLVVIPFIIDKNSIFYVNKLKIEFPEIVELIDIDAKK